MKTKTMGLRSQKRKKNYSGSLTNLTKPVQKPKQHSLHVGITKPQMETGGRLKGSWQKHSQKDGQILRLVWKLQAHKEGQ